MDNVTNGEFRLRIEIMGVVAFDRKLIGVLGRMENLEPAWLAIAASFREHMAAVFASEGGATAGGTWTELSPKYAVWKAKRYGGSPILTRTGALASSLTTASGMDSIQVTTPESMTLGTRVAYARYHQGGTRRMPARKIIDLPDDVKTRWTRIMAAHVNLEGGGVDDLGGSAL